MKKVSINELMGKAGAGAKSGKKLSLEDLSALLGERMPKLEFSPVGRLRVTTALRNRFGDNYRNLPGIDDIMKEFDREAEFNVKLAEMRQIRGKK
jgi:hypothetical protein